MNFMKHSYTIWVALLAAGIFTILCGLVMVTVQQNFRQNANDPQIQMAEDTASKLASGIGIKDLIPEGAPSIQVDQSLAPFMIIYDAQGTDIARTGFLNSQTPKLPDGVLAASKSREVRVTWQPQAGVRLAAVIVSVNGGTGGYVLAARNLREVEVREAKLNEQVLAAWIFGLLAILAWVLLGSPLTRERKS